MDDKSVEMSELAIGHRRSTQGRKTESRVNATAMKIQQKEVMTKMNYIPRHEDRWHGVVERPCRHPQRVL